MNIEETKKAIEVMQAFVDGKAVQHRDRNLKGQREWQPLLGPSAHWHWYDTEYRIKPEPKEIWVNEYDGCSGTAYGTKEEAENSAARDAVRKAVRYREVVEE